MKRYQFMTLEENILLDTQKIKEIIKHRYPFLLVDRVLELEEGKKAVAIKM